MTRIVVTGAAGFIGSHLVRQLVAEGHQVTGIDNLSTGIAERLGQLLHLPTFRFLEADVTDVSTWQRPELTEEPPPQEIYHLASPASPKFYQEEPFRTIDANTIGTKQALELARAAGAKVVFTSTSEVYGDPEEHPQREDYRGNVNTWGPRACYDESKRLGEVICYEYLHRYGVRVKVARVFNTYSAGLRTDDGRVISNFVSQAVAGEPLTIYGDGSQTRSFCYVDDTVRALRLMMSSDRANGQIINIGSPYEHTVLELAEMVVRLTGAAGPIVFMPLPEDDPKVRRPSIEKAKRLLGWEPRISLEEGLRRTVEDYRERLGQATEQKEERP
ncbi:NAD-dependent epimerase/dehydratase family protein [Paenibacillus koleovorans]|uniref:NAD-dependent epimerase/dehydratase family protein n=1 Tax=Paenibacillus koleovorans TaxID=121608 RepID=UPI000FD83497|nr:NAD-dependent epimerase/dehydratase family protein [Paenibacillus koleovorans]